VTPTETVALAAEIDNNNKGEKGAARVFAATGIAPDSKQAAKLVFLPQLSSISRIFRARSFGGNLLKQWCAGMHQHCPEHLGLLRVGAGKNRR
jgi:hypothetical protein